jgi:hypothetical protein
MTGAAVAGLVAATWIQLFRVLKVHRISFAR